jgi:hypothetical protein
VIPRIVLAALLALGENIFILWIANATRWALLNAFLRGESEWLARLLHENSFFFRGFVPMFCVNWLLLFALTLGLLRSRAVSTQK